MQLLALFTGAALAAADGAGPVHMASQAAALPGLPSRAAAVLEPALRPLRSHCSSFPQPNNCACRTAKAPGGRDTCFACGKCHTCFGCHSCVACHDDGVPPPPPPGPPAPPSAPPAPRAPPPAP